MLHRRFHTTDLSVQQWNGKWSVQQSQYDTESYTFYRADDDAYDTVAARLRDASSNTIITVNGETGVQLAIVESGTAAVATVSGLTRTVTYELTVTFTAADESTETQTLIIECVA